MQVLDASVAVDLVVPTERAGRIEPLLDDDLVAPQIIDLEVLSAIARLERGGDLSTERADAAIVAWRESPVERLDLGPLAGDAWALRGALRIADAYYVAAAMQWGVPLLTCDARLTRAPLPSVSVLLIQ